MNGFRLHEPSDVQEGDVGGGGGKFFRTFEKGTYFMMLKLSAAVFFSLTKILISQLCAHDSLHCHGNRIITCRFDQISTVLT